MSEEAISESDLEASLNSEEEYLENEEEEDNEDMEEDEDENDGDDEDDSVGVWQINFVLLSLNIQIHFRHQIQQFCSLKPKICSTY